MIALTPKDIDELNEIFESVPSYDEIEIEEIEPLQAIYSELRAAEEANRELRID